MAGGKKIGEYWIWNLVEGAIKLNEYQNQNRICYGIHVGFFGEFEQPELMKFAYTP